MSEAIKKYRSCKIYVFPQKMTYLSVLTFGCGPAGVAVGGTSSSKKPLRTFLVEFIYLDCFGFKFEPAAYCVAITFFIGEFKADRVLVDDKFLRC